MDTDKNESVSMYSERIRQLVYRAYPGYNPVDRDEQALSVFLKGLPSKNDFRLTMKVKIFHSLSEATEYAARLEQILKDEKESEGHESVPMRGLNTDVKKSETLRLLEKLTKDVSEVKAAQGRHTFAIKALQHSQGGKEREVPSPMNRPCLACGAFGHWCKDCPQVMSYNPAHQQ